MAVLLVLPATPVLGQSVLRDEAFFAFWQAFRAAVLAGDLEAVARMSRLPVESRGELDDEPVLRLTATTFPPAFRRLLATVDDPASGRTVLDGIRDTPRPRLDGRNASPGQVNLGSLQFGLGRNGWRLTTIYRGPAE
ncbi:hypothetical protein [Roseomonas populi]|uniref:DUF2939 domain-containing protein n=1 Tax=Roseomonas populi TaxID=3121582 RepID=A0ABT1X5Q4_9PROT|nr:hypothetical protein [Roseomonas pecuniae]MCR0983116.1 hypothetical protein [Roseomonas pecuniae]